MGRNQQFDHTLHTRIEIIQLGRMNRAVEREKADCELRKRVPRFKDQPSFVRYQIEAGLAASEAVGE